MLRVWLPLNGNLNNNGLSDVTVTNNGATVNDFGKIGKCYYFDGSSYIAVDTDFSNYSTTSCSLSCWVKPPTASSGNKQILAIGTSSGWGNIRFGILYRMNEAKMLVSISNGNKYVAYSCPGEIIENSWNHVVAVYNNHLLSLYINGELAKTYTTDYDISFSGITKFGVGAASNGAEKFTGYINDVRIYDHALSPREVKQVSAALVLHYPLSMPGQENLMPNSLQMQLGSASPSTGTWRLAGSSTMKKSRVQIDGITYGFQNEGIQTANDGSCYGIDSFPMSADTQYTISFDARIVSGTEGYAGFNIYSCTINGGSYTKIDKNYYVTPLTTNWTRCWVTFTTNSNTTRNIYIGITTGDTSVTTQMCRVKLERGSRPTPWLPNPADAAYSVLGFNDGIEYDVSGYGHNGTKHGDITYVPDTPRYNVSTSFNTNESYLVVSGLTTIGFSNSFSIAWWGKVTTFANKMMWGFSDGKRLNGLYNGNLWNTGDGSDNPIYQPETTTQIAAPSVNVWHHYVMTGDGTQNCLFVDGVLYGKSKTYKAISGTTIFFNGWDYNSRYRYTNEGDLKLSDFRIYSTALSAEDVYNLYAVGASLSDTGVLFSNEVSEV